MQGALRGSICYSSQLDALNAFYSGVGPKFSMKNLTVFEKVSGVWKLKSYQIDTLGSLRLLSESVAPVVNFPVCDQLKSFKEGHFLGWAIVGVVVIAWCVVVLRRAM